MRKPKKISDDAAVQKFWAKVDKQAGQDACWLWTGPVLPRSGYGTFNIGGKRILAHRWSAERAGMAFGRSEAVQRRCANILCVRPGHLLVRPSSRERFWSKVDKRPGARACWLWTGAVNNCGFGSFGYQGKTHLAHRLAAAWSGIVVTDWLCIRHSCRQPRCVRPDHLFFATRAEVERSSRIPAKDLNAERPDGAVYMKAADDAGVVRRQWVAPALVDAARKKMEKLEAKRQKEIERKRRARRKIVRCTVCRKKMPFEYRRRKYCGPVCKMAHLDTSDHRCALCGSTYPHKINEYNSKYCSEGCRIQHSQERYRDRVARHGGSLRPRAPERLAYCCICGKMFAHLNSAPRPTCGKSCGGTMRSRIKKAVKLGCAPPKFPVTRFCAVCFHGFAGYATKDAATCSSACLAKLSKS